ncbi:hypothetical protein [Acinetobacter sp. YH01005]|uniref:hypothetical protein n=1 Tax=Acinetobacter sp. YH01005 TaxID=2601021 RepID=UPI0015D1992F|nr:hypothetical protein [Acinetobacter sp. YH01005]
MDISTITTVTLTEAEIQEAVKQYIQNNGLDLENKDVEFTTQLPKEIQIVVSKSITKDSANHVLKSTAQPGIPNVNQFALEQKPLIQNKDANSEQHEVSTPSHPIKRRNPFALDDESQSTNTPTQTRNSFEESKLMPSKPPKGIFA